MPEDLLSHDQSVISLTGSIIMWWGRIEFLLFNDLLALQHHPNVAKSQICERIQSRTKDLVAQWRKASVLATEDDRELTESVELIAERLQRISGLRHVLVHWFWPYPDPNQNKKFRLTFFRRDSRGQFYFRQHDVDGQMLGDAEHECIDLYHRLLWISIGDMFNLNRASSPEP